MQSSTRDGLKERLMAGGSNEEVANACSQLFSTEAEAKEYIGSAQDAGDGFKSPWKEYYSIRYQRYYYVNDLSGLNVWDIPKPMQLQQWILDAEMFQLDIGVASALFKRLLHVLNSNWHLPQELWECVALLAKIVNNIVSSGNSVEKYRQIKTDNQKIKDKILGVTGAAEILEAAGFLRTRDAFTFPSAATPLMMAAAGLVASRLTSLEDKRGFTGDAKPADDPADGNTYKHSKHHNTPGFRYQTDIYECSICNNPINDGSERLFTRSHEAPHGQFRYECQDDGCMADGGFNLCEQCWDIHNQEGSSGLHLPGHTFRTFHPRASRHFMFSQETAGNPWGVPLAGGGSAARARQRLKERHGL